MEKKKKKTKKEYEQYLNELYKDCYSDQQVVDMFVYMTVKQSKDHHPCRMFELNKYVIIGNAGYLVRKFDPMLFNIGFNEFCKTNN
jgi:hypothetical protein